MGNKPSYEELKRRNRKLRDLIDSLPQIIIETDLEGNLTYANKMYYAITGYSKQDFARDKIHVASLAVPEDRARIKENIRRILKGEKLHGNEYTGLRKDGSTYPVQVFSSYKMEEGRPTGIRAIIMDITERRQAREAEKKRKMQLDMAIEAANIGLWDWDLQTDQIYYSPEWKRQIGYADHEIPNDLEEWRKRVHPDDLEKIQARTGKILKGPRRSIENEYRFQHRDGGYRWILSRVSILNDQRGEPIRMLGAHLDITKRKQAEEKLRQQHDHLEELVARRTAELWKKNLRFEESNVALKVLLRQLEQDRKEIEEKIVDNVDRLVLPYIGKLKASMSEFAEYAYLEIIESNLKDIISPFVSSDLARNLAKLTPTEIEITDLIKQGHATKDIAGLLKLSPCTVATHRQNIRKKLGITNEKVNLRTVLAQNKK